MQRTTKGREVCRSSIAGPQAPPLARRFSSGHPLADTQYKAGAGHGDRGASGVSPGGVRGLSETRESNDCGYSPARRNPRSKLSARCCATASATDGMSAPEEPVPRRTPALPWDGGTLRLRLGKPAAEAQLRFNCHTTEARRTARLKRPPSPGTAIANGTSQ